MAPDTAACEWCGRAVAQNNEGRWYAVKGEERGYDPLTCDASEDGRHASGTPMTPAAPCQCPDPVKCPRCRSRMTPITVGRLRQLLGAFHDATEVWISEDNLLHRVEVDAKTTAAGYGVVLHRGDRVTW